MALFEGPLGAQHGGCTDADRLIANDHRELGRGHAERLVPMIADLPENGRATRIYVSLGPGSFTGVRIGIATARALGVAWGAEVLGYPTLALAAQTARQKVPGAQALTVCMNGGHGEYFVQNYGADGAAQDDFQSLAPHAAKPFCQHPLIAGNRAQELARSLDGDYQALNLLPDASIAAFLPDAAFTPKLSPIYGRAPDAVPQARPN